jgi:hypothetical protein
MVTLLPFLGKDLDADRLLAFSIPGTALANLITTGLPDGSNSERNITARSGITTSSSETCQRRLTSERDKVTTARTTELGK